MNPVQKQMLEDAVRNIFELYGKGFTDVKQITSHESIRGTPKSMVTRAIRLLMFERVLAYNFRTQSVQLTPHGRAHYRDHGPILYPAAKSTAA